jgi:hypothetical protein
MQLFIDVILLWALMLGWSIVGVVIGALLISGYIILKDWSERYVG